MKSCPQKTAFSTHWEVYAEIISVKFMNEMGKVELLAPAGSFQALKGALHAGADAVYLGGEKFGARAYADNFTMEEIIQGIHFAHVFGRKIYLTVNTLVKDKELDSLYDFLLPFYEQGLDGVIVQDLGALRFIRTHFPGLLLHASTQMALTGSHGAKLLQKEGISRIVPARELSLEEIKKMKESTGIEIETFIHGAMCYSYSGQCLFSSILGGRSGNRGRCAQPCRLPYQVDGGRECYPLSMRDMCTLKMLPELIRAGIDSFKIEGRMKRPEYAAGVTSVYRKYIDRYYEEGTYQVEPEDEKLLNSLYIRSDLGEGYYYRHNGREMLTLDSPAYSETDERLIQSINERYISKRMTIPVNGVVSLQPDAKSVLILKSRKTSVAVTGDIVQKAQKKPLTEEKIKSQIQKDGNSLLEITQVKIENGDNVFMPISALNKLRRLASDQLETALIRREGLWHGNRRALPVVSRELPKIRKKDGWSVHAVVLKKEQLLAALQAQVKRIYIDYSLLISEGILSLDRLLKENQAGNKEFYIAAPYVSRMEGEFCLDEIRQAVNDGCFGGVLVRNLESFAYLQKDLMADRLVLDAGIYLWNKESICFFKGKAAEFYLPFECNAGEWKRLSVFDGGLFPRQSMLVYGRLPMMVSAGCVEKTEGTCQKQSGFSELKDRYDKVFPVYHDCISCYNVIYNSVPLSLHKLFCDGQVKPSNVRLDFTTENGSQTGQILAYFNELASGKMAEPDYKQYTTGHFKRGVD